MCAQILVTKAMNLRHVCVFFNNWGLIDWFCSYKGHLKFLSRISMSFFGFYTFPPFNHPNIWEGNYFLSPIPYQILWKASKWPLKNLNKLKMTLTMKILPIEDKYNV